MPQVKVYGRADSLRPIRSKLSDVIQSCMTDGIGLPPEKRFQRFILIEPEDFIFSMDRTEQYIIIEISMFEGRDVETKKKLLKLLMERIHKQLDIPTNDIEITIFETPKCNWGIRGQTGDELGLSYKVEV